MGRIFLLQKESKKMRTVVFLCVALLTVNVYASAAWTYNDISAWSTSYSACSGNAQSPIDIPRTSLTNNYSTVTNIQTSLKPKSGLKIKNAGGKTQKVAGSWGTTTWSSKTYTMLQFHSHQPSEHTFDGMRYDMELHFVHQNGTATDYLVLTALFNIGPTANKFLTDIKYASGSATTDAEVAISGSVNVWDVLGAIQGNGEYIHYSGSFTTPPCTEGVTFVIFRDNLTMSKAQWDGYVTSLPDVTFSYSASTGNHRPVNALNGRTINQTFGKLLNAKIVAASLMTIFALLFNM